MKRLTPNCPPAAEGVIVYACVRNELKRLPWFLEYHRQLGVRGFMIVDNNSTDGTKELLAEEEDCSLYWTDMSYSKSRYGVDWTNKLLSDFGCGHWGMVLDVDELLVYPHCESLQIDEFTCQLESENANGLLTFMLDMYAEAPLRDVRYSSGEPFLSTCPYFDTDSYSIQEKGLHAGVPFRGGVRQRVFWNDMEHRGRSPFLAKIPLVKWREGLEFTASTHRIQCITTAQTTGALLHFKLFSDFYEAAKEEADRGEHWDGAAQYEAYWNVLKSRPDLNPFYSGSVRYENSMQLVELGLMRVGESCSA